MTFLHSFIHCLWAVCLVCFLARWWYDVLAGLAPLTFRVPTASHLLWGISLSCWVFCCWRSPNSTYLCNLTNNCVSRWGRAQQHREEKDGQWKPSSCRDCQWSEYIIAPGAVLRGLKSVPANADQRPIPITSSVTPACQWWTQRRHQPGTRTLNADSPKDLNGFWAAVRAINWNFLGILYTAPILLARILGMLK